MKVEQPHGVLGNWILDAEGYIHGQVFGDTKGRFANGEQITTSRVSRIERINGLAIAVTKYSRYVLA